MKVWKYGSMEVWKYGSMGVGVNKKAMHLYYLISIYRSAFIKKTPILPYFHTPILSS